MILLKCIGVTVSHNMLPSSSHHGRTVKQSQNKLRNALVKVKIPSLKMVNFQRFSGRNLVVFFCSFSCAEVLYAVINLKNTYMNTFEDIWTMKNIIIKEKRERKNTHISKENLSNPRDSSNPNMAGILLSLNGYLYQTHLYPYPPVVHLRVLL